MIIMVECTFHQVNAYTSICVSLSSVTDGVRLTVILIEGAGSSGISERA